jgi:hypothetical protein
MAILTFETAGQSPARIRLSVQDSVCPPERLDDRLYVIAVQRGVPMTTLETRSHGRLVGPRSQVAARLLLVACAPVDPAASGGFVRP